MGKLKQQLDKELGDVISDKEKRIRAVLINAVARAQEITEPRWDTGFLANSWFFSKSPFHTPQENPAKSGGSGQSVNISDFSSWKFGENAFVVNNAEYASYHDLGTIYIVPLFVSFQVEVFIENQLKRIK